jgi:hypothetical protein
MPDRVKREESNSPSTEELDPLVQAMRKEVAEFHRLKEGIEGGEKESPARQGLEETTQETGPQEGPS